MKYIYFWPESEIVLLHDGNIDDTKSSLHPCLILSRGMVPCIYFHFWEISATVLKKMEKIEENLFFTTI